nr:pentatricopeptide repeat-containing protein At1g11710, mitochondrial [Ipomoea batatas]
MKQKVMNDLKNSSTWTRERNSSTASVADLTNLDHRNWFSAAGSVLSCVFNGFRSSPQVMLKFYKRIGGAKSVLNLLESCVVIHVMIKLDEVGCFWLVYREMVSYGHMENVKSGIVPNVVSFNMLIDKACRIGDLDLAFEFLYYDNDFSIRKINC